MPQREENLAKTTWILVRDGVEQGIFTLQQLHDFIGATLGSDAQQRYQIILHDPAQVAREMALGALQDSTATVAVATTGILGPEDVDGIPAGTICFAWAFQSPAAALHVRRSAPSVVAALSLRALTGLCP